MLFLFMRCATQFFPCYYWKWNFCTSHKAKQLWTESEWDFRKWTVNAIKFYACHCWSNDENTISEIAWKLENVLLHIIRSCRTQKKHNAHNEISCHSIIRIEWNSLNLRLQYILLLLLFKKVFFAQCQQMILLFSVCVCIFFLRAVWISSMRR